MYLIKPSILNVFVCCSFFPTAISSRNSLLALIKTACQHLLKHFIAEFIAAAIRERTQCLSLNLEVVTLSEPAKIKKLLWLELALLVRSQHSPKHKGFLCESPEGCVRLAGCPNGYEILKSQWKGVTSKSPGKWCCDNHEPDVRFAPYTHKNKTSFVSSL